MNKSLFALLAVFATSSFLTIGCGTTADLSETETDWLQGPDQTERPGLGATYLESETSFVRGGEPSADGTETEEDHARKPKTIENDLLESDPGPY